MSESTSEVGQDIYSLITYDISAAVIEEMKQKCSGLVVSGFDDKEGYDICKQARLQCRDLRTSVEKRRKELKSDSLEFGRRVDAMAKELMEPLKDIEGRLLEQQNVIDDEVKRRAEEEARLLKERVEQRVVDLAKVGCFDYSNDELAAMPKNTFEDILGEKTAELEKQKSEEALARRRLEIGQARLEQLAELGATGFKADLLGQYPQEEYDALHQKHKKAHEEALVLKKKEQERLDKLEEENKKLRAEAQAREAEEASRLKAEAEKERQAREAEEAKAKAEREAQDLEAQQEIQDNELLSLIRADFPTLPLAWVEIARLTRELAATNKQK